ncbi:GNAT family acetyltransferase [Cryobacterium roopkundense]|uniref:GNAT family acetyltransferase n=1 Tax=Cryobacterium roopkundense TaxID=1001240 RepID=A0A099J138_9MICO|nr:GNAT family N-acetyltransferase [Cryobacterium roopkundense]KGJ71885.1 GNAT family acetyltransferase [Cryobacterium roopkundense]MBB5642865.1 ribosomal protein S18 acetylase RimI-like enzyme [Cryobacterium roopkundense]
MEDELTISIATHADDGIAEEIHRLIPQLSQTAVFDQAVLTRMLAAESVDLFLARIAGTVVGMATLVTFPIPTGLRGHIDDVVVDGRVRGRGIARELLNAMIARAQAVGVRSLDLTSRPSRESAIRLYEASGFVRRDSAVFRYQPIPNP